MRVFLSYRRGDSPGYAGRLYDRLVERFGGGQVFMDIDTIAPGEDFVERIERVVSDCDAAIVLIGQDWLNAVDEEGKRRLDDPEDFVRIEVAAALERSTRVIPVLVRGARMPSSSDLPEVIAPLARRNAIELTDERWRFDTGRLIKTIETTIGRRRLRSPVWFARLSRGRKVALAGLALAGAAAIGVVLALSLGGSERLQTLPQPACSAVEYGGQGSPDALIATGLVLDGSSEQSGFQLAAAVRRVLRDRDWKAGSRHVALQVCSDSTPEAGRVSPSRCAANAQAYASDPDLLGVVDTACLSSPSFGATLNRAPDGGVPMVLVAWRLAESKRSRPSSSEARRARRTSFPKSATLAIGTTTSRRFSTPW